MTTNEGFTADVKDYNIDKNTDCGVWTVTGKKEDKAYTYEEAITLAGNGSYTYGLLAVLSLTLLSMGCDMFGFSVVLAGSQCDLQFTPTQRSTLMSMPFLGPIIMSYPWGYFSDTQGRKKCLLLAMSCSFVATVISSLSPNWIMLAVLKFLSTSCSSCAQFTTYALLGESSGQRVRGSYMLIMTSVIMLASTYYYTVGYFLLNMEYSIDLGFISFVPWRLLVLALALPAGISSLVLHWFYESPKFLANAGREDQAVELLRKIWKRNGGKDHYPVKKLILNEDCAPAQGQPLLRSLWQQTAPLFQTPLLWRTLQLYYITTVVYSVNNSLLMWLPFIANTVLADGASEGSVCDVLSMQNNTGDVQPAACSSKLEYLTTIFSVGQSVSFGLVNGLMSRLARMKLMLIVILVAAVACGTGIIVVTNKVASFVLFLGIMGQVLGIGIVSSYFVELYPTSYLGMSACLGVVVARTSVLIAINLLSSYITTSCHQCFYAFTAYIFSGLVASFFLPADGKKKT
ncbi:synaptic vesicle glycoprotein 2C-like [Cydia splendana]|uniref:synaptic vesicle glycoprotein 2C-like n=1 Tax=Cydia splendana TaxID=1100963 RepID=UPI0028F46DB5